MTAPAVSARGPGLLRRASIRLFRLLLRRPIRLALRIHTENEPALRGPYVLVANHTSFLDPLLLGAASPRHVTYLMSSIHWRSRAFGWFYRWMGAIPLLLRGGNRDGLRAARAALQRGEVLGVFPEGGISRDGRLMLGSPGAVALVFGENVPVVPVGIVGAAGMLPYGGSRLRRVAITIRFGTPIAHDELVGAGVGHRKDRLQQATRKIMDEIARLSGQQSREQTLERAR